MNTGIENFTLKNALPGDVPLIVDYIKKLAAYERLADKVMIKEEDLTEFLFGERKYAEVIMAYEKEELVGFALYFHNFSTFAGRPGLYLEDVFIDPEYRGKGYGKEILKYLTSLALDRGCARFEWSVLDWNTPAIDFYKTLGAIPMDDWTVFRMDTESMKKLLKIQ